MRIIVRSTIFTIALLFLFALSTSCSDSNLGDVQAGLDGNSDGVDGQSSAGLPCSFTYECNQGYICDGVRCISAGSLTDVASDSVEDSDATQDGADGDVDDDGGETLDASDGADGEVVETRVTFAPDQYRRCRDSLECAVFGGNCITELALSRPDADGTDRVAISDLDSSFEDGEGVCSFSCTNDPRICTTVVIEGPNQEEATFTCQVVYSGSNPYPASAPAFPFDDTLDLVAMERGRPFASICRPPFQVAEAHSPTFCSPCQSDDQCDVNDVCFIEQPFAETPLGSCVETCGEDADCPFGFACEDLDDGKYCLPIAETCGRCLDKDGDTRGAGRCGPLDEPTTGVDCDDSNPVAYFSSRDPGHSFPELCGDFDNNCNGISDREEQLGSAEHCGACGDICRGRSNEIANAVPTCVTRESSTSGFECVAECQAGFADCDGDLSTGCESQLEEDQLWYRDADGDGRGDARNLKYFCDGNAPAGWVQNSLDCDDEAPNVFGGNDTLSAASELCDGIDNDCNGTKDDAVVGAGEECATGFDGVCATGLFICNDQGTEQAASSCVPNVDPESVVDVAEICDGLDNNCNGEVDEDIDYYEAQGQSNPNGSGAPAVCNVDGGVGICATGEYQCAPVSDGDEEDPLASFQCVPNLAAETDPIDREFVDSNCDGSDGVLDDAVYVRPAALNGTLDGSDSNPGTPQRPVATIQRAFDLACGAFTCRDIFVEEGEYSSRSAIRVPGQLSFLTDATPHARLYGGFETELVNCETGSCELQWTRAAGRSELIRQAPAESPGDDNPYGKAYMGLIGDNANPINLLLNGIEITVESPGSTFLENGQNAPTQTGIQCGSAGCKRLEFVNTRIVVENAIGGGNGTSAGTPATANNNGVNGATSNIGQDHANRATAIATLPEGPTADCTAGGQNRGGRAAAARYLNPNGGNRLYILQGFWGSGSHAGSGGGFISGGSGYNSIATRGSDGSGGSRGRYFGWGSPQVELDSASGTRHLTTVTGETQPIHGLSGSGGGGGGGCLEPGNNAWDCPPDGVDPQLRGGSGGGGGCAGLPGSNGGMGGNAVGIWLIAPGSGSYEVSFVAQSGDLALIVGNGGDGGDGTNGSAGAAGGYGGTIGAVSGRGPYDQWQGGNGGDGGGGGGGAGGGGGQSFGIVRMCVPGNVCNFDLPSLLLSSPATFITLGDAGDGGAGGNGGEVGEKPPLPDRSDTRRYGYGSGTSRGVDGADGQEGTARAFYDTTGRRN